MSWSLVLLCFSGSKYLQTQGVWKPRASDTLGLKLWRKPPTKNAGSCEVFRGPNTFWEGIWPTRNLLQVRAYIYTYFFFYTYTRILDMHYIYISIDLNMIFGDSSISHKISSLMWRWVVSWMVSYRFTHLHWHGNTKGEKVVNVRFHQKSNKILFIWSYPSLSFLTR